MSERPHFYGNFIPVQNNYLILDAACETLTIYIRKTIYFAYAKLYVLYKVYPLAFSVTWYIVQRTYSFEYA